MNKAQQETRLMYLAVIDLFERSADAWTGTPPLVAVYTRFKTLVKDITDTSLLQQQNNPTGYTADKNAKRNELIKGTFSLSLKLKSFAKITGNTILAKAASLSMTDLEALTETDLINTATTLSETAWQYTASAADYQVTPEFISDCTNPLIVGQKC